MKNYKCSLSEAAEFFYDNISKNAEVVKLISASAGSKQLSKNALFREFVKKQKKELYYRLRKYKGSDESKRELMLALNNAESLDNDERIGLLEKLSSFHVSSNERFVSNEVFYTQLKNHIGHASQIVDVGCGVQPLFFPHDQFPALKRYVALDKDRDSVEMMDRFREVFKEQYSWLQPFVWNIDEGWNGICTRLGIDEFDVALLLKLVPVVKRVDPSLVQELAKVPARMIIVSGVKESMVKKHDIERKERRAIRGFLDAAGKEVTAEFEIDNEFFMIVN
ncbi:MAG TPA: hypothetical protein VGD17_04390 [Chitinophagaceae bacterium]